MVAHNDSTNVRRVEMWYLVNPATGNNAVVVTESISSAAATIGTVVGATTFTGADQTSPIRAFASNDSNGAAKDTVNVTVASGANDMVLDTLAIDGNHTITSASGTQVQQWGCERSGGGRCLRFRLDPWRRPKRTHVGGRERCRDLVRRCGFDPAPQSDLGVTVSGTSALFPTNLSYTMTVTNNGPAAIPSSGSVPGTTVTLTDTLATGLTLVSATPSQGSCSGTTTITCNLVTNAAGIAVGGSVTITVIVTPGAPGGYPNNASVTSSMLDLLNANNSASGVAYSSFAACATSTGRRAGR